MEQIRFEWDPVKAAKNFRKHGVSFPEAATIFNDPDFITVIDDEHSIDEDRFITIGLSNQGRLLMLAHTDAPGIIRIISARKATRSEGEFYAKTE